MGALLGSAVGGFPGALVGGAIGTGLGGLAGFGAGAVARQRVILIAPFRPVFVPYYYFYY